MAHDQRRVFQSTEGSDPGLVGVEDCHPLWVLLMEMLHHTVNLMTSCKEEPFGCTFILSMRESREGPYCVDVECSGFWFSFAAENLPISVYH